VTLAVDTTLDVSSTVDLSACGGYTVIVTYANGAALTGDPFTYSETAGLTISTSNPDNIGVHYLALQVYLTSYPSHRSNIVPLTVTITDTTCPLGTAAFIPNFQYDRDLGDS